MNKFIDPSENWRIPSTDLPIDTGLFAPDSPKGEAVPALPAKTADKGTTYNPGRSQRHQPRPERSADVPDPGAPGVPAKLHPRLHTSL